MDACVVDVQFLQNDSGSIFAKKILITGITKTFKVYNKEITFSYPDKKQYNDCEDSFSSFGNLELTKKAAELKKTLCQFNTIVVSSKTKRDFIENYTPADKKLVVVKANEHNRNCSVSEKDCEE
jgi:hypothetical protein